MRDKGKTKEQLIGELSQMRQRLAELEALETGRKQAEERLKESEERYRSTLDNMLEGCQIIGYDWRYLYVNDAVARHGHQAKETLLGHTMMEMYPGVEDTAMFAALRHCMEKRIPHRMENEFTFPDGAKGCFELSIEPVPDGVFLLSLDITERKQVEERLVAEKNFSESIISSFPTVFYLFDKRGKFLRWNKNFEKVTGYSAEEILKMTPLDFFAGEEKEGIAEKMQEVFNKGSASIEAYLVLKNRKKIAHLFTGVRTIIDNKVCLAGVGIDITERKRMEEQLIVTDRLASIGELVSGVAHELNNPLTGVIGFSDLLASRKDLPDDVMEDLKIINSEAQRTANIVKNLLTFARKHPKEKQAIEINMAIEAVLELRTYEQRLSNIEVNTRLASDLPDIIANSFDLQQVFLNIVVNAEHAMIETHKGGTITIITERDGDIIRALVSDDGPGISKGNLGHVFDPFFTTKEVGKGTGLGLSICHGIITEHGGKIYVESELGKGATFIIELPVATADNEGATGENP